MCSLFLFVLWTSILRSPDISEKKCFVRHIPKTGEYLLIERIEDTMATDFDVSADFEWLINMLSLQAFLMWFFCGYQLLAIYVCHPLLKYRFIASRCNKMCLLFGLLLFI